MAFEHLARTPARKHLKKQRGTTWIRCFKGIGGVFRPSSVLNLTFLTAPCPHSAPVPSVPFYVNQKDFRAPSYLIIYRGRTILISGALLPAKCHGGIKHCLPIGAARARADAVPLRDIVQCRSPSLFMHHRPLRSAMLLRSLPRRSILSTAYSEIDESRRIGLYAKWAYVSSKFSAVLGSYRRERWSSLEIRRCTTGNAILFLTVSLTRNRTDIHMVLLLYYAIVDQIWCMM